MSLAIEIFVEFLSNLCRIAGAFPNLCRIFVESLSNLCRNKIRPPDPASGSGRRIRPPDPLIFFMCFRYLCFHFFCFRRQGPFRSNRWGGGWVVQGDRTGVQKNTIKKQPLTASNESSPADTLCIRSCATPTSWRAGRRAVPKGCTPPQYNIVLD